MNGALEARFELRLGAFALDARLETCGRGITVLAGPSGCGKTTLLRCIAGLEPAARGRCTLAGAVWHDSEQGIFLPPHRRAVGCVFQHANLFPHLSVQGNLRYGWRRTPPGQRKLRPEEAAEMMGLGDLLERRPARLSGGERQRVAIARALLTGPEVLLMDEPLASLDPASKREIFPYLERLHERLEVPVLYVSHNLGETARLADRVVLMERGGVAATGELSAMLTRLDLSLAAGEEAQAIVHATVESHDQYYGLTLLQFSGGVLSVARLPHPPGAHVRVGIAARDVSLALSRHTDTSIQNIFPARVIDKREDGGGHVLVRLDSAGTPLLARITRKSAHDLGLAPAMELWAQIKSAAILS